jgi:hypothetical protein
MMLQIIRALINVKTKLINNQIVHLPVFLSEYTILNPNNPGRINERNPKI